MRTGDIVYYPFNEGFIRYVVDKVCEDDETIIVHTPKTKQNNWLFESEVIPAIEFKENNNMIYE